MDMNNCCVVDAKSLKVYHPGSQKEVQKEIPKRVISDSEKLDAILSMMYTVMKEQNK